MNVLFRLLTHKRTYAHAEDSSVTGIVMYCSGNKSMMGTLLPLMGRRRRFATIVKIAWFLKGF